MNLIKFNPFIPTKTNGFDNLVDELFDNSLSNFFGSDFLSAHPAVNVREDDKSYTIEIAAPGLDRENFDLNIEDDYITVSGKATREKEEKNERYMRREFGYASFERRFQLPENVDSEAINAKYENGVLNIHIPKMEATESEKARKIEIS